MSGKKLIPKIFQEFDFSIVQRGTLKTTWPLSPFYSISVRQYKVSAKLKENAEMQDISVNKYFPNKSSRELRVV